MATSILQRTIFIEQPSDGYIRFQDWARVVTTVGSMAEPFQPNLRTTRDVNIINFDATDDMALVTEIQTIDSNRLPLILSGGDYATIGGHLMPRTGR